MKNQWFTQNLLPTALCVVGFLLLALLYASPVLSGQKLFQHDIVQYQGGAQELLGYRDAHGEETYWSDSMFGGMPTYQMGAQFPGDVVRGIDKVLMLLPKPVGYIFLLCSGFFLLGMVVLRRWPYALLGALLFGFSTYFYIIIAAGHNGKVHTIAYFAPLLAGVYLLYFRRNYLWGFVLTAVAMALQLAANHPQMSYYLFLALGVFFLSEIIRTIVKKLPWRLFLTSTALCGLAFAFGIGMNAQRLMANAEYIKETVRGQQIQPTAAGEAGSGMDRESLLAWSYGKLETLNLFIPRLMGGGSNAPAGEAMMQDIQQLVQENAGSQQEVNTIIQNFHSPTYWGDQPGTSGPAYQGSIVMLLFVLALFAAPKRQKYWIVGASVLAVLLAWGSNFPVVSDFFIDYMPFYNKFRAPSSILVLPELLLPLLGIVGLYYLFTSEVLTVQQKKKYTLLSGGILMGITLLLLVFGKSMLGFLTEAEQLHLPDYLKDYLQQKRFGFFAEDAVKALAYVAAGTAAVYLAVIRKIRPVAAVTVLAVVAVLDLWQVNREYLSSNNFVPAALADQPFQTEKSMVLEEAIQKNPDLGGLLSNTQVNAALAQIAAKDPGHYRVYNQVINPFAETNTSFFHSSVGGYHAVKLRRYDDLINEYFTQPDTVRVPKVLNLLNTRYMIFGDAEKPQPVPNPYANGNAWLVSQLYVAKDAQDELKKIGELDTKRIAILGSEDAALAGQLQGKIGSDAQATLNLTQYQPNRLVYKSSSRTPQLGVFSEMYYPHGWEATVDGKPATLHKADYLLRALEIPAGQHTIEMTFQPKVLATGKYISLAATLLFILVSALLYFFLERRRKGFAKKGTVVIGHDE